MTTPPHVTFPEFYGNPTIRQLASSPRWTVSDIDKMPIDIRELQANQRLRGAFEKTTNCLMPLDELVTFLPDAANHAFALNAQFDQYLVLDIEKTCPPEVARELLAIPALYTELSLSGHGYHLLMPIPASFGDYPIAAGKVKLQEEHGWYEVLLDHWVTFTRTQIPAEHLRDVPVSPPRTWSHVYATLAEKATVVHIDMETRLAVTADKPRIPGEAEAIIAMTQKPMTRGLDDYHGDHSRYEFSVLGTLLRRLSPMLPYLAQEFNAEYTVSMKAWLLYEAACEVVPHRAKHNETRNGMPLMLNAATELLARNQADSDRAKNEEPDE